MSGVQGDIDLTQNLDFYRKKPTLKLPSNVQLKSRRIKENDEDSEYRNLASYKGSFKWNISYEDSTYNPNSTQTVYNGSNTHTTISFSNNINYINTSTTVYDIDTSSMYISNMSNSWNILPSDYELTVKKRKDKKYDYELTIPKPKFTLWKPRPILVEKSDVILCKCSSCGKYFLAVNNDIYYCKNCSREAIEKKAIDKVAKVFKLLFKFFTPDRLSWFDSLCNEELEGRTIEEYSCNKPRKYARSSRVGIPWLQELPRHMYDDYIEELTIGEKDYSSYLTNMGWLRIDRNEDEISTINISNISYNEPPDMVDVVSVARENNRELSNNQITMLDYLENEDIMDDIGWNDGRSIYDRLTTDDIYTS